LSVSQHGLGGLSDEIEHSLSGLGSDLVNEVKVARVQCTDGEQADVQ
jgi:hypothetical protein